MLPVLQKLFAPKDVEPETLNGKVTLGDVLRRDWFELWYQPKIDLKAKRLVGAEALVRARRPDGSMISPGAFLPGAAEFRRQNGAGEVETIMVDGGDATK